jgi:hypothetical protein
MRGEVLEKGNKKIKGKYILKKVTLTFLQT